MQEVRTWIPMDDGARLAVTLYHPAGVATQPVILEALPYRKDDATLSYRAEYRRLADEGHYHVARVDVRGTGSSEGIAVDEYTEREQNDLEAVIAWLSEQPWSSGAVGMYGTSYSGFNSLQLAARRPEALRAVIAIYATDDRFTDDVHYSGGALRAIDLVDYCHYMTAFNALPPVPSVYGDGWRDEWRRRIDHGEPWLLRWLHEQVDGPYWRNGSLRMAASGADRHVGYERIQCATMIVAGWADGYRNNTFRTFERLRGPKSLLFGPWSHMSTANSLPGPHLDLVPEMLRWWDRWLRGVDNGVDREPPIRVFVKHATKPEPDLARHEGEWRFEPTWPPDRLEWRTLRPRRAGTAIVRPRGGVGTNAWISCAGALPWGQPLDQRGDDAFSVCLDWPVGDQPVEVLGAAVVTTRVRAAAPVAQLSAKLESVFPDGTSALVARGLLNLTHRDSMTSPTPLVPGQWYDVDLELDVGSWVYPPDHTIRLALAGSDWPNNWMAPTSEGIDVDLDATTLLLPVVAGAAPVPRRPEFTDAHGYGRSGTIDAGGVDLDDADRAPPKMRWQIEHDVLDRVVRAVTRYGHRSARYDDAYIGEVTSSIDDPAIGTATATTRVTIRWPEATVTTEARLRFRSDAEQYHVEIDLDVDENEAPFARRTWHATIPRHLQ
jgi:predicted acyl esterase